VINPVCGTSSARSRGRVMPECALRTIKLRLWRFIWAKIKCLHDVCPER